MIGILIEVVQEDFVISPVDRIQDPVELPVSGIAGILVYEEHLHASEVLEILLQNEL